MRAIRNPRVSPNLHFLHIALAILVSNWVISQSQTRSCFGQQCRSAFVLYKIVTSHKLSHHMLTLSGVHMIHASPVHAPVRLLAERRNKFQNWEGNLSSSPVNRHVVPVFLTGRCESQWGESRKRSTRVAWRTHPCQVQPVHRHGQGVDRLLFRQCPVLLVARLGEVGKWDFF